MPRKVPKNNTSGKPTIEQIKLGIVLYLVFVIIQFYLFNSNEPQGNALVYGIVILINLAFIIYMLFQLIIKKTAWEKKVIVALLFAAFMCIVLARRGFGFGAGNSIIDFLSFNLYSVWYSNVTITRYWFTIKFLIPLAVVFFGPLFLYMYVQPRKGEKSWVYENYPKILRHPLVGLIWLAAVIITVIWVLYNLFLVVT